MTVEKAKLTSWNVSENKALAEPIEVDFNPQSLRLNYGAVATPGAQGAGTPPLTQNVTHQAIATTTDLAMELLFDSSRDGGDVREKTLRIAALMQPGKSRQEAPVVHFQWGSFVFTGYIQSLGETIDVFSEQGIPLRASLSLSMRGVESLRPDVAGGDGGLGAGLGAGASAGFGVSAGVSAGFSASAGVSASAGFSAGAAVGTTPLTLAHAGDTIQDLAARAGATASWKTVASANGVENPRLLAPGTVLNLNARASARVGF